MFFNWVIFVDHEASQNAGPGSGERAEPALRRPCQKDSVFDFGSMC